MKDFAAIDFETANNERHSVCSIGVVIVRDNKIEDRIYSLIKPAPNYYKYWNTKVHGLTHLDTDEAPLFPEVWEKIAPKVKGLPMVAHNSMFDEGCLKAVHKHYGITYPNYKFYCTYRASQKCFEGMVENHKLHTVAAHVGYNLEHHHHALADAEACAEIALHVFQSEHLEKIKQQNMKEQVIGIMGAMAEEINGVVNLLSGKKKQDIGGRTYYSGRINGTKVVVVFSRWGKVAAAMTASTLILKFKVSEIIFTGVAGAVNPDLNIGDIVIGKRLIQHDMDGRPLTGEFEIPLLKKTFLDINPKQLEIAEKAVSNLLDKEHLKAVIDHEDLKKFNINNPKLVVGDIASGDLFFSKTSQKEALIAKLPTILCVEMEGAAVAQVCYEYNIPFTIFRTISDAADDQAHIDFPSFIEKVSNLYSVEIIKNIFQKQTFSL